MCLTRTNTRRVKKIKMQADQKPVIWTVVIATILILVLGGIGIGSFSSNVGNKLDIMNTNLENMDVDEQAIANAIVAGIEVPDYPEFPGLIKKVSPQFFLPLAILTTIFVPFGEELFHRGMAYTALRKRLSVKKAIILSAFLFAAGHIAYFWHLDILATINIFIVGLLLAWQFERSKSLIVPYVAHVLLNSVAPLLDISKPYIINKLLSLF